MKKAIIALCVLTATATYAEVQRGMGLNRVIADGLYVNAAGDTMTGMLTLKQGTQTDEAIFFSPSGMSIYSGNTFLGVGDSTNTWVAIGNGIALRSGGTVTWSSSATDALAAADLRVLRTGAGAMSIDGGSGVDGSVATAVFIPGAGTAAAPSIQVDGGSGIYRFGVDSVGISTADTARWVVNASGALVAAADGGVDIGNGASDPRDLSLQRAISLRGARFSVSQTAAPTAAVASGFGGTATVAVDTGSTDLAGTVTLTIGATPTSNGTVTVTFDTVNGAYGTNPPTILLTGGYGTGGWHARSTFIVTAASTTAFTFNCENSTVALTEGSTYKINYVAIGK